MLGEPQANHAGLTGADVDLVVRRDLGALLAGVHRVLVALHHAVVDAVLDVGALVLLPGEEPLVVGFVLGEEQRHVAFAGKDELTEHRMRRRDRARACRRLDLPEVGFLRRPGWIRRSTPTSRCGTTASAADAARPRPAPGWPP